MRGRVPQGASRFWGTTFSASLPSFGIAWLFETFSSRSLTFLSVMTIYIVIMDEPWSWKHVGRRVREHRLRAGLSQTELARAAKVAQSVIAQTERGRFNVQLSTLQAIAPALRCSVGDLVCGSSAAASQPVAAMLQRVRIILESDDKPAIELVQSSVQAAEVLLGRRRRKRGQSDRRSSKDAGAQSATPEVPPPLAPDSSTSDSEAASDAGSALDREFHEHWESISKRAELTDGTHQRVDKNKTPR